MKPRKKGLPKLAERGMNDGRDDGGLRGRKCLSFTVDPGGGGSGLAEAAMRAQPMSIETGMSDWYEI